MKSFIKPLAIFLLTFFLSFSLYAQSKQEFNLKGDVLEINYSRATFYQRKGKWKLSTFFPYSNQMEQVADRLFDPQGLCLRSLYLRPDGEPRYTEASKKNENQVEKICYNYLTKKATQSIEKYNQSNQLIEKQLIKVKKGLVDTRYYTYDNNLLIKEEAYGVTGNLYERISYKYDEQGRCVSMQNVGLPYNVTMSFLHYYYNDQSSVKKEELYGFDKKLKQRILYQYDSQGEVNEKVIFTKTNNTISKQIFRYEFKYDSKLNWTEKIVIEVLKEYNRWKEKPLFFYRRRISYLN